jgi:hypothetical protein
MLPVIPVKLPFIIQLEDLGPDLPSSELERERVEFSVLKYERLTWSDGFIIGSHKFDDEHSTVS